MLIGIVYNCEIASLLDVPQASFKRHFLALFNESDRYGYLDLTVNFHERRSEVLPIFTSGDATSNSAVVEDDMRDMAERAFLLCCCVKPMTKSAALRFVNRLQDKIGVGYHPDTRAAEYVNDDDEPLFSELEAEEIDENMDRVFDLLGDEVYEIGLNRQHMMVLAEGE